MEGSRRSYPRGELSGGGARTRGKLSSASILAMVEMEIRRLMHDPSEIVARAVQPILWIVVFGVVMARRVLLGVEDYRSFIAPGVVFQSATFISLAYGIMMVFERESGILKRLLSTPIPRSSIVIGRALAGSIRASTQYVLVILSAFLVGAHFKTNAPLLMGGYLTVIYVCMGFTALSILIASLMKTRERFMGIIGAITMPLFFASNALYPISIMPTAIKIVALVNPLSYAVDMLRGMLLGLQANYMLDLISITAFNMLVIASSIKLLDRIIE